MASATLSVVKPVSKGLVVTPLLANEVPLHQPHTQTRLDPSRVDMAIVKLVPIAEGDCCEHCIHFVGTVEQ